MTYPQDFSLFYSKKEKGEGIIDSYELLENIIDTVDKFNMQFSLDNNLPLIQGNRNYLNKIFTDFTVNIINKFKAHTGTIHILYKHDLDSTFLFIFIKDQTLNEIDNNQTNLVETISDFNFAVCKEILNDKDSLVISISPNSTATETVKQS